MPLPFVGFAQSLLSPSRGPLCKAIIALANKTRVAQIILQIFHLSPLSEAAAAHLSLFSAGARGANLGVTRRNNMCMLSQTETERICVTGSQKKVNGK